MVGYRAPASGATTEAQCQNQTPNSQAGESGANAAEIQICFPDYQFMELKRIGQVWLPHQINKSSDGQPIADFRIDSYKLNPTLKPGQFEEKR